MNERIKELELEAAYDTIDPNGPFTAEEFNQFTKKFAELIVQECTKVLFDEAERLFEVSSEEFDFRISDDLECCAEQCMDNIVKIEKHFGVE